MEQRLPKTYHEYKKAIKKPIAGISSHKHYGIDGNLAVLGRILHRLCWPDAQVHKRK
jgi:hypothetical protein